MGKLVERLKKLGSEKKAKLFDKTQEINMLNARLEELNRQKKEVEEIYADTLDDKELEKLKCIEHEVAAGEADRRVIARSISIISQAKIKKEQFDVEEFKQELVSIGVNEQLEHVKKKKAEYINALRVLEAKGQEATDYICHVLNAGVEFEKDSVMGMRNVANQYFKENVLEYQERAELQEKEVLSSYAYKLDRGRDILSEKIREMSR